MRLIRSIEIERFRSFERVRLDGFSDLTALVGPNNSGKSNIIRALNLFFNDETDPGAYVDFDVDYQVGAPRKKKKEIRIAVEFDVPEVLQYRKGLGEVKDYLGNRFRVRKTYSLDAFEPDLEIAREENRFEKVAEPDVEKVRSFLRLVSFRYVPNRAVPAEVIREQSRGLLKELASRVAGKGGGRVGPVISGLQDVARTMASAIAKDMRRSCPGITKLELATPSGLLDMLSPGGFRAGVGSSGAVPDTSLGAGAQSLLMFHVLHLIDRSQSQRGFGWRQATVWGVEEPESSLHRELQLRLAALLRAYAHPASKFQIVMTTHSDVFVYSASTGFAVTLLDSKSRVDPRAIPVLADEAAARQVTGWCPPPLKFPLQTVVLIEGPTDRLILQRAAQLTSVGTGLEFCTVSQLDPSLQGDGRDQIKKFLATQAALLPSRLRQHPLLVLVDWDTEPAELQKRYGPEGNRHVAKMEEAWCNPYLDTSFKGIERLLSTRLIERAKQMDILPGVGRQDDGTLMVGREELERGKARLADLFRDEAERADCEFLRHALEWAERIRAGLLI